MSKLPMFMLLVLIVAIAAGYVVLQYPDQEEVNSTEINDITEETENVSLDVQAAISSCQGLCRAAVSSGKYMDSGPCLSEASANWQPSWSIVDWACDVAHLPRLAIDNLAENQCLGQFHHFVETYPNCTLIRAV